MLQWGLEDLLLPRSVEVTNEQTLPAPIPGIALEREQRSFSASTSKPTTSKPSCRHRWFGQTSKHEK